MDFQLKIVKDIINILSLFGIFGIEVDNALTRDTSIYLSVPEYMNITKKYINTKINVDEIKIDLCDYQNADKLTTICKSLLHEYYSNMLLLLCIKSDPDIAITQDDIRSLKECSEEYVCENCKIFVKVRVGEKWNDNDAIDKVKRSKMKIVNILNNHLGYKEV